MAVQAPILLDNELNEQQRLNPITGMQTIKATGCSECVLTLPPDAPDIKIHDWIRINNNNGFSGYYRVSNIAFTPDKRIEITLLHGRDILNDSVYDFQGNFSGNVTMFLAEVLNRQTALINGVKPWSIGTVGDRTTVVDLDINYDRLEDLLQELEDESSAYCFTYNMETFPWQLNYVAKDNTVVSEFRLSKNVQDCVITINDSELCTRLFVSDTADVTTVIDGQSVTRKDSVILQVDSQTGIAAYGIVVKTAAIETTDDLANQVYTQGYAFGDDYIAKHSTPSVQIQIDGEELYNLTGIPWDEVQINGICRVSIPQYNQYFDERVISVTYPDMFKQPSRVNVSLANILPTVTETLAVRQTEEERLSISSRGGGGGSAASAEEMKVWSKIVAEQMAALDGTGVMTLYASGIDMSSTGGVRIFSLQQGLQALYSGIEVNASQIALKVSNGEVATQLAVECGNVTITGGNLIVDGMITANNLETAIAGISTLNTGDIVCGDLTSNGDFSCLSVDCSSGLVSALYLEVDGNYYERHTISIDNVAVAHFLGDNDVNFSGSAAGYAQAVADCKVAVAAALADAGWSGNHQTVISATIDSTNQVLRINSAIANIMYPGESTATPVSISLGNFDLSSLFTSQYNQGWNDCLDACTQVTGVWRDVSLWNSGSAVALYVSPASGAAPATGSAQVWKYGGRQVTMYTIPTRRT